MEKFRTELKVRNTLLKNRIIMPPMATASCDENGFGGEKLLSYYADKTKSGLFAMVITEHCYVSKEGKARRGQMAIDQDADIAGLSRLVNTIHQNHTIAIAQLSHSGGNNDHSTGLSSIGPSASPLLEKFTPDKEMSESDITRIVQAFVAAARRAINAGYDGVEIHSAHAYLLNQFYSPLTNRRTDSYGGVIANRIKLHLQIIQEVRKAIGNTPLLLLRLGALDYMENGSTLEDAIYAAKAFESAGIDILDVSGGLNGYIVKGKEHEQGYYKDVSAALKKAVSIPIITTGGIQDISAAEAILQAGEADLIGVGRSVLKDSNWIVRAFSE